MSGPRPAPSAEPTAADALVDRVLAFVGALRLAGVGPTQSEAIDVVRALPHVDLLDRAGLREALAALLTTSRTHRGPFDELFDVYWPARPVDDELAALTDREGPGSGPDADPVDADAFVEDLLRRLLDGDDAAVRRLARRAVEAFGRVEGRDGSATYFRYRVLRAIDLERLLDELVRRAETEGSSPLATRLLREELALRLEAFRAEVDAEVRRRAVADRGPDEVAARTVRPPLEDRDLLALSAAEQAEMRAQVRPLARRLASRLAVRRDRGRDGRLDVRRTVRRSMATGGVPFDPAFRPRRPHRPELLLVCDVSGSVASFARFTLMLVHALQGELGRVRSFAFVDDLDEVTHLFASGDLSEAVQRLHREARIVRHDGHSDYGHALERFHAAHAREVTPRSTVIVLGDARTNYRPAGDWVLEDLARRARHVYWLNPEPRAHWDTGDSVARRYARHVEEMVEVRSLSQLAAFVERVA